MSISVESLNYDWRLRTPYWEADVPYLDEAQVTPDGQLLVLWSGNHLEVRRADTGALVKKVIVSHPVSDDVSDRARRVCAGEANFSVTLTNDEALFLFEQYEPPPRLSPSAKPRRLSPVTHRMPLRDALVPDE